MNDLIETINARVIFLRQAIRSAEKDSDSFPEGRLRTSKGRHYQVTDKANPSGEYLHKHLQSTTIKLLAQKAYTKSFIKKARSELVYLEKTLSQYKTMYSESVYDNLSNERKAFVSPYILPDDLFAKEWQSKIFKPNPYKPENKIYNTRRGELVRSKSEAIIADMLYELNIPYRYESPVRMYDGRIRYPDFTLLKKSSREVIYLEHFGLLDDEGYRKDTLEKLDIYRLSGIYPGKNLIFTYEAEKSPLDINGIKKMLKEIVC